jgi:hypothetical protein
MTAPGTPASPPQGPGAGPRGRQRFGHVIGHRPTRGTTGVAGTGGGFLLRDDDTSITYSFGYADIVTEGLRTVRTGERVRFLIDPVRPGRASYVIRLDLPDVPEYYP